MQLRPSLRGGIDTRIADSQPTDLSPCRQASGYVCFGMMFFLNDAEYVGLVVTRSLAKSASLFLYGIVVRAALWPA